MAFTSISIILLNRYFQCCEMLFIVGDIIILFLLLVTFLFTGLLVILFLFIPHTLAKIAAYVRSDDMLELRFSSNNSYTLEQINGKEFLIGKVSFYNKVVVNYVLISLLLVIDYDLLHIMSFRETLIHQDFSLALGCTTVIILMPSWPVPLPQVPIITITWS